MLFSLLWADEPLKQDTPAQADPLLPLEFQVTGQKNPDIPLTDRVTRLEAVLGQPAPRGVSMNYRISQLYTAQQNKTQVQLTQGAVEAYNHAIDATNANHLAEAIVYYEEAIKISPDFVEAYNNLANLYERQDSYDKAIVTYRKVIPLRPNDPLIHRNLGVVLEKSGDIQGALAEYEVYLKMTPEPDEAIQEMVTTYKQNHAQNALKPDYVELAQQGEAGTENWQLRLWPAWMVPIPVLIQMSSADQASYLPVVEDALKTWTVATRGRLRFRDTNSLNEARIVISLQQGPLSHPYLHVGRAEYNIISDPNQQQQDLRVHITVNTGEPSSVMPLKAKQEQVHRLALHEIGHAIGIWGHSPDPGDIMYVRPVTPTLSNRDVTTIQKLYGIR